MSASRADRARLTAALALAGVLAASGGARAQVTGPPVRLGPGAEAPAEPHPFAPPAAAPDLPAPEAGEAPLAALAPDAAGVLVAGRGGLGAALWAGTPLALVQRLLAELPVAAPSPTQRRLTLRLLLSAAEPPAGDAGGYRLAGLRVAKLAALGAASDVGRLVAAIPGAFTDETIARAWVEAQMLQAPDGLDCQEVARLAKSFSAPVWPKLVAACPFATRDATAAPPALAVPVNPGAADLVLAQAAGVGVGAEALASIKEVGALLAVARAEATDPDIRAVAAERAAVAGALTPAELAAVYASVRFPPAVLARPLSAHETGVRARALVYQAMVGEAQPAARAELIRRAFDLLEPAQRVGPVAAVALSGLAKLPADPTTAWLAPGAVRLLLLQGKPEAAAPWLELSHAPADLAALERLWPLSALVEGGPGRVGALPGPGGLGSWLEAALREADGARRARVGGVLALLQAAGEPVGDDAWARVADRGSAGAVAMPSAALWQALQSAIAGHRTGEVALVSLAMLGDGGPQALAPVALAQIVTGLSAVGLGAEARGLAREAVAALLD